MKKLVKIVCCNIIYRVKYIGIEKIDNNKKYVICPNHSNILDPTFIFPIVDNLSIMAKSEIFKNKLVAKILKRYRVFPVNRKERDVKSTLHAIECLNLENNSKLLIFPEGGIIKDSKEIRKKVKNGAVYISAESGVEILPIFITRRPHIFQKVYVIIGNSINIPKEIKHDKEKIKEYSTKVINNIYDLEKIK
ncbi:MAG: lysophospholipid acyltransferase family protein [Clostridia bacterium]|nr:1-acyl-sn-glycerol-3-phosphate acyltransferase [Clostridium sp.]MEE0127660.1 lysophospholipid acyltransferase family protein [Clostridia bacterium]HJJ12431.1 1-acyl-sn-glycerol-3-phosphate acyltransferase [Clostridiaceae bacterium]